MTKNVFLDIAVLNTCFQELLSIRKVYTQEDYESGRLNMIANYCPSVLPGIFFIYIICDVNINILAHA